MIFLLGKHGFGRRRDDGWENPAVFWSILFLTVILLLIPLAVVEIPPLLDYPNHMARMYVLAFGKNDPALSKIYAPHWSIIPNIFIDLVVPPLLRIMPLEIAGRLVVAIALLLPILGGCCYAKATFGRVALWQLGIALVVYHSLLLTGFLNFDISLGLALMFSAHWIAHRDRHPRNTIAFGLFSVVCLFFVHIFGLAYYLLLVGSQEFSKIAGLWRSEGRFPAKPAAGRMIPLIFMTFAAAALSLLSHAADSGGGEIKWSPPLKKLAHFFSPWLNYCEPFDIATALFVFGIIVWAYRRKQIAFSFAAVFCSAALLAIFLFFPQKMMQTDALEVRWPVMFGFLLFAGIMPVSAPAKPLKIAYAGFAMFFVLKMGILTGVWIGSRQDVISMREAIAPVPSGSRVLVTEVKKPDNPHYWKHMRASRQFDFMRPTFYHLPALLVNERQAFWPLLFSSPFKQPIMVLPPYKAISMVEGEPPSYRDLDAGPLTSEQLDTAPYLSGWRRNFDYVLVLLAGGLPDERSYMADQLIYLRGNDFVALYKIRGANNGNK